MRKFDGWITALFALVFIAAPAIVGFYFFLSDWGPTVNQYATAAHKVVTSSVTHAKIVLSTGALWGIAIGFIFYSVIFSGILILTKVLTIDSLTFVVPIAFVLASIFLTGGMSLWGRALIVVALVLCAFPMNMAVTNLKRWQYRKNKQ